MIIADMNRRTAEKNINSGTGEGKNRLPKRRQQLRAILHLGASNIRRHPIQLMDREINVFES